MVDCHAACQRFLAGRNFLDLDGGETARERRRRVEGHHDVIGGQLVAVGGIASSHDQPVAAVGAGGENVHDGLAFERHRHEGVLEIRSVVSRIVEIHRSAPVDHRQFGVADLNRAIEVVHHEGVVAAGAGDVCYLEQVLQVFDGGVPGEAVAGVDQFVGGVRAGFEGSVARTVEQVADDQPVVVEANVGTVGLGDARSQILDEGVDFILVGLVDAAVAVVVDAVARAGAGIEEFVKAQVARIGVAAQAAVEDVVEARTLEDVIAVAGDDRQRRAILCEVGGGGYRGGYRVVAATRGDNELVALGPDAVGNDDLRRAGTETGADTDDTLVGTVGVGQRNRVTAAVVSEDGDGVSRTIVGSRDLVLLDQLAARVFHEFGARLHNVFAGAENDELQPRAGHEVDGDVVGAAAGIHAQVFKGLAGDGTRYRAGLEVGDGELIGTKPERGDKEIIRGRRTRDQESVVAIATDHLTEDGGRVIPVNDVVAAVAEHLVGTAASVDFVRARAAMDDVGAGAAEDPVAIIATVDFRTTAAVVNNVVPAGAAEQEGGGAPVARHHVVVAGIAIKPGFAAAVVDEDVVAFPAVELYIRRHSLIDVDVVVTRTAEGHDLLHTLENRLATAEHHADDFAARIRAEVLDLVQFVALTLANAANGVAVAHVEVQHPVGGCRVPGAGIAGRIAGQVNQPRQFDVAEGETHAHRNGEEQELDFGRRLDDQRHPARTRRRHARADAHAGKGDAEGPQFRAARELYREEVFV